MSFSAPRLLVRSARTYAAQHPRLLATKASPPPVDPHPYISQIHLDSSPSGSSRLAGGSENHIGPFPLPPGADRDANVRAAEKSWRQLRGSEKVGRAATQTSALFVVLAGGGLAALVLYATGTELWAPNSPTRVFEDCTERVKASEELRTVLLPPFTFHGANSSQRLRRNRRISSTLSTDPVDGAELLLVRFWVEGQVLDDGSEQTWWDSVKKWVGPVIWEDSTKPGSYVPRPSSPPVLPPAPEPVPERTWGGWVGEGVASVFGGVIPRVRTGEKGERSEGTAVMFQRFKKPKLGEYSTGEVVAELKKDPTSNTFVYTKLYVEVPDARAANRYRINIPTAVVGEPQKGWDRLRFWNRTRTASV